MYKRQRTIRPLRQEIVKEADALLQDIEMLFQKIFIFGIQVMLPYMCSQPGFSDVYKRQTEDVLTS